MQALRVALIQLAWAGTRDAMIAAYQPLVGQAAAGGAAIVCLPELSLSPYFPGTRDRAGLAWAEPLAGGDSDRCFNALARTHGVTIVGSLFERTPDGHLYDTATLHDPTGRLIGSTRKVHIPSGEGYHETDFFEAG